MSNEDRPFHSEILTYLDSFGIYSMRFEEGGSRIDDLKLILGRVAFATSLFDHDGISVRVCCLNTGHQKTGYHMY